MGKDTILFLVLLVGLGWYYQDNLRESVAPVPPALEGASRHPNNSGIKKVEFMSLLDEKTPLSDLAVYDHYTVVEVYLDSCSLCKKLEAGFDPFIAKRRDTYIRRVHFPEGGIRFSFSGTTQEEIQRQADETNALMESYNICGTPHVVIFGPDGGTIASDGCGGKQEGTRHLQNWINAETGLLKGNLGKATSVF